MVQYTKLKLITVGLLLWNQVHGMPCFPGGPEAEGTSPAEKKKFCNEAKTQRDQKKSDSPKVDSNKDSNGDTETASSDKKSDPKPNSDDGQITSDSGKPGDPNSDVYFRQSQSTNNVPTSWETTPPQSEPGSAHFRGFEVPEMAFDRQPASVDLSTGAVEAAATRRAEEARSENIEQSRVYNIIRLLEGLPLSTEEGESVVSSAQNYSRDKGRSFGTALFGILSRLSGDSDERQLDLERGIESVRTGIQQTLTPPPISPNIYNNNTSSSNPSQNLQVKAPQKNLFQKPSASEISSGKLAGGNFNEAWSPAKLAQLLAQVDKKEGRDLLLDEVKRGIEAEKERRLRLANSERELADQRVLLAQMQRDALGGKTRIVADETPVAGTPRSTKLLILALAALSALAVLYPWLREKYETRSSKRSKSRSPHHSSSETARTVVDMERHRRQGRTSKKANEGKTNLEKGIYIALAAILTLMVSKTLWAAEFAYKERAGEEFLLSFGTGPCLEENLPSDFTRYHATADCLIRLANQGDKTSQTLLGQMYLAGIGVPRNDANAYLLLEKSANQHDPIAHWELARIHQNGWGKRVDLAKALTHYRLAKSYGESKANERIAKLEIELRTSLWKTAIREINETVEWFLLFAVIFSVGVRLGQRFSSVEHVEKSAS